MQIIHAQFIISIQLYRFFSVWAAIEVLSAAITGDYAAWAISCFADYRANNVQLRQEHAFEWTAIKIHWSLVSNAASMWIRLLRKRSQGDDLESSRKEPTDEERAARMDTNEFREDWARFEKRIMCMQSIDDHFGGKKSEQYSNFWDIGGSYGVKLRSSTIKIRERSMKERERHVYSGRECGGRETTVRATVCLSGVFILLTNKIIQPITTVTAHKLRL